MHRIQGYGIRSFAEKRLAISLCNRRIQTADRCGKRASASGDDMDAPRKTMMVLGKDHGHLSLLKGLVSSQI
ncbi:MAG: hypothetical protein ACK58L_10690, partial [Planctomycetota bacterium]